MSMPAAAKAMIAAKEPANITGASSSRVKMTICGPMMAVKMPPASTKEMARALNSRRRVVGGGEAELLNEGAADADDQQAERKQPEARRIKRGRGDGAASRGDQPAGHEAVALAERAR